jgi:hypothetical protein
MHFRAGKGARPMIWVKRRFDGVDYAPYMDRLQNLMLANATLYSEFLMVSTKTDDPLVDDYCIGFPNESLLSRNELSLFTASFPRKFIQGPTLERRRFSPPKKS